MDYEKKYRDLIEAVKELQEANPSNHDIQNWVKDNVPELMESEDERIRKALVEHCREQADIYKTLQTAKEYGEIQSWIAWLEKQGDQKDDLGILQRFSFYSYKDEPNVLYLAGVFVNEECRNKGIGTKILKVADEVASSMGCQAIRLKAQKDTDAYKLYTKNGYGILTDEGNHVWLEKQDNIANTTNTTSTVSSIKWHSVSEEPEEMRELLCEWNGFDHNTWHDIVRYRSCDKTFWNSVRVVKNITRWCYIDDLEKQCEQNSSYSSCESDIDFKIEADKWYVCIKDYYYSDIDELMFTKGKAYKAYTSWGFISNNGTKKTPIGMFPYKEYFRPATDEEIPHEQKPAEWHREDEQNLNACLGFIRDEYLRRWLKDVIHVKYDKTDDKVEPKFKVGDIIKHNKANITCKVLYASVGFYRLINILGGDEIELSNVEKNFHLWTIKDAKDGDVLVTVDRRPFIYKGYLDSKHPNSPVAYCGIDSENMFFICESKTNWWTDLKVQPSTKEQRDTLMKAMADAGYKWDAENKELKKIEQTPTWSNTDLISLGYLAYFVDNNGDKFYGKNKSNVVKWILSLANRTTPQQEWSEEDETMIESIIDYMKPMPILFESTTGKSGKEYTKKFIKDAIKWLKSLKDRCLWKPSDEQMDALETATSSLQSTALESLYNELKKLKEE